MTGAVVAATSRRRGWVVAGALAAVAVVGAADRRDLVAAARGLGHLDPTAGALLLLSSVVLMGVLVARHRAAHRALGVPLPVGAVTRASLTAQFVNSVSKSGGVAGVTAFVVEGRRHGGRRSLTIAAYLLVVVMDQLAFALVLAVAMTVLVVHGRFESPELVATAVFAVYVAATVALVVTAVRSRTAVRAVCALPGRCAAWASTTLLRRPRVHRRDDTRADELHDAFVIAGSRGPAALRILAPALAVDLVCALQLWLALAALGVSTGPTAPLVAYAVGTLFATVGFLPGGIGLVEISSTAVLHSFGVPLGAALAAVVCARIVEFWIPLTVGAFAARRYLARSEGVLA